RPEGAADRGPKGPFVQASCRFDSQAQRLIDFELPDLEGKPIHLQDLDADLILLDFWGSWCKPCLKAIPHLVQMQTKLGTQRLKVVGIAYEKMPPESRVGALQVVAQNLGINYPILIGEADGRPCPLQAALKVENLPTMILIDRHGRILWRQSGLAPLTLARLDYAIASHARALNGGAVRR
ncbi:MAG: TlpA family protein disulfide reductase, partial [Isosphaeraceae bacterium]|nr:TlpA family protein disulfide reductase [Isosphaeraceae bacterium]